MIRIRNGAINWRNPVKPGGLNDGLVSWWLARGPWVGGGTWFDLCRRNNGTLSGVTWGSSNRPGGVNSLNFASSGQQVNLDQTITLDTNNHWSVEFWAYQTTSGNDGIVLGNDTNTSDFIFLYGPGPILWYRNSSGTDFQYNIGSGGATTNAHYVLTHKAVSGWGTGTITGYRNGLQVGTTGSATGSLSITCFGDGYTGTSFDLGGAIESIAIFNRTLSASDVWQRYQDSLAGYPQTLNRLERRIGYVAAAASFSPWYALNQSQYARVT